MGGHGRGELDPDGRALQRGARRYLVLLALAAGLPLLAAAVLNVAVDPFFVFHADPEGPLAAHKVQIHSRTGKTELLRRIPTDTLLLGTSRTEVGIDPESAAFADAQVFNGALQGATFYEVRRMFEYGVARANVRRVLLFVDFLQFSPRQHGTNDFEKSRLNPHWRPTEYYLEHLLSWRATKASLYALRACVREKPAPYTLRGRRWGLGGDKDLPPTREMVGNIIAEYLSMPEFCGAFAYSRDALALLRAVVRHAEANGIELIVAIPPVHAVQLEMLRIAGLWKPFEQWKRDLVKLLAEETDSRVPLWDFSGYQACNTEAIPPAGVVDGMRWYVESSHFKAELGDRVLAHMLTASSGFGDLLTPVNIGQHLAQTRAAQAEYHRDRVDDVQWVEEIAAQVAAGRL